MINICFDGRVLKNGLVSNSGRSGIYFVARNLLIEMLKRNEQIKLFLYLESGDISLLDKLNKSLGIDIKSENVLTENGDFSDINSFFSPIFRIPDCIRKFPNVSCYTVIHDVIPLLFSEYFTGANSQEWFGKFIKDINGYDYYFSNSDYTKSDFLKYFKQLNEKQIDTMLLGPNFPYKPEKNPDLLAKVCKKYNIPNDKKYLFSLCSLEPRKNLIRAVKNFIAFIKKNNIDDIVYVLGGGAWDGFIEKLEQEVPDYKKYANKIIRAGYVDDEDLGVLYSNAEWFVYTSQYEGFGMPPLEAMSCGCPVIASNNSSLPEVVGNAGIMIDFDSDEQHIAAYEKYYNDKDFRKSMANKGFEQSKNFSWKKALNIVLNKMQMVEKKKANQPLITIVTPTFNLIKNNRRETFIQSVTSAHNQTYRNIEHIVIDGASNDGTIDLLQEYQNKGWIKYYSEPDKGLYDAINKGILRANGKYIVVLNSDDFYCDDKAVEMLVRKAEELSADAVCAGAQSVNPDTLEVENLWPCYQTNQLIFGAHACHQTFLIKTDVMKQLGLYDLEYKISSDTAFMYKMLNANKKIVMIEPIIITYRLGGVSNDDDAVKKDVINAFYKNYGQYHGLTKMDASNLIYDAFLGLPVDDAVALGSKLERPEWIEIFYEKLTNHNLNNNKPTNVIINPGPENPKILNVQKYYIFDMIPLLKTKLRWNVKRYLLFGFLPILKTKYDVDLVKMYLFAFIPIVFRKRIRYQEYTKIVSGEYKFSGNLPFETKGIYYAEDWGRWSEGDETSFFVRTEEEMRAEFNLIAFLVPGKEIQNLTVYVNNREYGKYVFESGKDLPKVIIDLPKSKKLHIMFKYNDVKSPADVGVSGDARKIAIGFITVKIEKQGKQDA